MYECFHCQNKSVIWECDYDFEDFGLEGEGIVHTLTCAHCGADIQYFIPIAEEKEVDENEQE